MKHGEMIQYPGYDFDTWVPFSNWGQTEVKLFLDFMKKIGTRRVIEGFAWGFLY